MHPVIAGLALGLCLLVLVSSVTLVVTLTALTRHRQLAMMEREAALMAQEQAMAAERMARVLADKQQAEKLHAEKKTLLELARTARTSNEKGRRARSLEALKKAAAIQNDPEVRQEYILSLSISEIPLAPEQAPIVQKIDLTGQEPKSGTKLSAMVFSPAEDWLALDSGNVMMIDVQAPAMPAPRLAGAVSRIGLAFDASGERLWQSEPDGSGWLWQLPSSQPVAVSGPSDSRQLMALGFDAQGQRIAAGSERIRTTSMYDLSNGKQLWTVTSPAQRNQSRPLLRFSPDSKLLGVLPSGSDRSRVRLLDAIRGRQVAELPEAAGPMFFRGPTIMAIADAVTLGVRDLHAGKLVDPPSRPASERRLRNLSVSGNGQVCGGFLPDGTIEIWDLQTRNRLSRFPRKSSSGDTNLLFNFDGTRLAFVDGNSLKICEAAGKELRESNMPFRAITWTKQAGKKDEILILGTDLKLWAWDPAQSAPVSRPDLDSAWKTRSQDSKREAKLPSIWFSTDGKRLISLSPDNHVHVWDTATGKALANWELQLPASKEQHVVSVSPDGLRLAAIGHDECYKVWNLESNQQVLQMADLQPGSGTLRMRFNDAGNLLAVTSIRTAGGQLHIYDLSEGLIATVPAKQIDGPVFALADQGRLMAIAEEKQILIRELRSPKTLHVLAGHSAPVIGLSFAGGGEVLASLTSDGMAMLWNAATGERIATMPGQIASPEDIKLSRSAGWAAVSSSSGHVYLWNVHEMRRQLKEASLDFPVKLFPELPLLAQPEAELRLARYHHLAGRHAAALEEYGKALPKSKDPARVLRERGETLNQLQRFDEAVADMEKARELAPDLPPGQSYLQAIMGRAMLKAEAFQWSEATASFLKAVREGADRRKLNHESARIFLAADVFPSYQRVCHSLVEHMAEKEEPAALQRILWTAVLAPKAFPEYQRLIELAEDALDRFPKEFVYHTTLGALLHRAGEYDAAIARLKHAEQLAPGGGHIRNWLFLALAYYQAGHAPEGRPWLNRALQGLKETRGSSLLVYSEAWIERLELLLLLREAQKLYQ